MNNLYNRKQLRDDIKTAIAKELGMSPFPFRENYNSYVCSNQQIENAVYKIERILDSIIGRYIKEK
jgi:hypothetical protein